MKNTALILIILSIASTSAVPAITVRNVPAEYATIQLAIDASDNGDVVIVAPGHYYENINFNGKNITVASTDPENPQIVADTIIDAGGTGSVVTFANSETADAVLTGFTITGGRGTLDTDITDFDLYWGPGIFCRYASPTITANVITNNHGPVKYSGNDIVEAGYGGAISCYGGDALITRNIIRDNTSFAGAGLLVFSGNPNISSNIICNNSAEIAGGVVLLYGGRLHANTIVENTAQQVGNLYIESENDNINVFVTGNLICYAQAGGGVYGNFDNCFFAYNNVWNNNGGDYTQTDSATGKNGNISADPLFVDLNAADYHLQTDSPCINAGDPQYIPLENDADIDNQARVFAGRIDIGADEYIGYLPPVADAGPDQHILDIQLVTLDGSDSWAYDSNTPLLYYWTQISGPTVVLSNIHTANPTFKPPQFDRYEFELVVKDSQQTSSPNTVVITVGNTTPIADAGRDIITTILSTVVLDGSASYDDDSGDQITYAWRQTAGPNVTLNNPDTANPSFQCDGLAKYTFELIVSDSVAQSQPDYVDVTATEINADFQPFEIPAKYAHYPDVYQDSIVYGLGSACDYTWNIQYKNLSNNNNRNFAGGGIDTQPKIDGDIVVWFGGPSWGNPWYHEPSNMSIFARNLSTNKQKTLRQYSYSESYSHPAISGNKVVWLEHLGLDPNPRGSSEANNWWNTPYNICGADISSFDNSRYFTIAENVGTRDPYPCHSYSSDFDDVIDIYGDMVVYEANGDIFGADISDLNDIVIFIICDHPARQFDPSISGSLVIWTDQRDDSGDIYAADISNPNDIQIFELVKKSGSQHQAEIHNSIIVYVDGGDFGQIRVLALIRDLPVELGLPAEYLGCGPAVHENRLIWQDDFYGKLVGLTFDYYYAIADGPVMNITQGKNYDFIQHAITDANTADHLFAKPGDYFESVDLLGKNLILTAGCPNGELTTIISPNRKPALIFQGQDANCVLDGFVITESDTAISCNAANPTIKNCFLMQNETAVELTAASSPVLCNSLIAGNNEYGILSHSGNPTIRNCTITENGCGLSSASAFASVESSIIWANNTGIEGTSHVYYSDVQNTPDVNNSSWSPLAYWNLDESNQVYAFDIIDDRDGTIDGPIREAGFMGNCLYFDGIDDYVAMPQNDPVWLPSEGFTVCLWAFFERDPNLGIGEYLFDLNKTTSSTSSYRTGCYIARGSQYGKIHFNLTAATGLDDKLIGNTILQAGQWYYVTVVRNSTYQAIYIDGQLDADQTCSAGPIQFTDNSYNDRRVNLGCFSKVGNDGAAYFQGYLDEVAIYNRALSVEEIETLYLNCLDGFGYTESADGGNPIIPEIDLIENICIDPCFVDANFGNFRLTSQSPCINTGDPNYTPQPDETDIDGLPRVIAGRIDMGACEFNHKPVADAGHDQTVYAWLDGFADVNLDGSASYDDDYDTLNYYWSWMIDGNDCESNGVTPTIELPAGQHQIELVVDDNVDFSEPNYCTVTVIEPLPGYLRITPRVINVHSRPKTITAMFFMPPGIRPVDIADEPLLLYPGAVESQKKFAFEIGRRIQHRRTVIFCSFDKNAVLEHLTKGSNKITVAGRLTTGRCFYGKDTIRLIEPRRKNK